MDAIIRAIFNEIKSLLVRSKVSTPVMWRLATDLTLVACEIRTGYLVDAFSPEDAVSFFSKLFDELKNKPPMAERCRNLLHVYDDGTDQSFIVHVPLLRKRIQQVWDGQVNFVSFEPAPHTNYDSPMDVRKTLSSLLELLGKDDQLPVSILLPSGVAQQTLVAFAGILLDYKIAYIPPKTPLTNVSLDFYEAVLSLHPSILPQLKVRDGYVFFKFSCPAELTDNEHFKPANMVADLQSMFDERVKGILELDSTLSIMVKYERKVLDRVVF